MVLLTHGFCRIKFLRRLSQNPKLKSKMKKILLLSILFVFQAQGQKLRRAGALGVQFEQATDSLMQSLRVPDTQGIVVKKVQSGSTAAQLGIEPGDVLVAINETDSLYLYDFQKATKKLRENENISLTFVRKRQKSRVVGSVVGRTREASVGEVIYGEVAYRGGFLRSIVHRPTGVTRAPAVFFVQDMSCNSIDYAEQPYHPFKQLVDGLVRAGYAVCRVEKPGVGESEGTADCSRTNFDDEVDAYTNGLRTFKKYDFVDSSRVFLFGHSVGGMAAPLIANKVRVKGMAVYGTVAKTWFEHLIDLQRKRSAIEKVPFDVIEENVRVLTPFYYEWLVENKTINALLQNPQYEAIMTAKNNPLQYEQGKFSGRAGSYFPTLNQKNLTAAWGSAGLPTLALHGEYDIDGGGADNAKTIADVVNERSPGRAQHKVVPKTEHNFTKFASMAEYLEARKDRRFSQSYTEQNFSSAVVEILVGWMNAVR